MRLLSLALLASICIAVSCKKDEGDPVLPTCANTDPISIDTGNAYFTLPTAFTPNSDGVNDIFTAFVDNIDTAGFSISIKEDGTERFSADNPYFIWRPEGYLGRRTTFDVDVTFRTMQGARIETCAKLTIPRVDSFATCAHDIDGLYFPDQINIANGKFDYPTGENECP